MVETTWICDACKKKKIVYVGYRQSKPDEWKFFTFPNDKRIVVCESCADKINEFIDGLDENKGGKYDVRLYCI